MAPFVQGLAILCIHSEGSGHHADPKQDVLSSGRALEICKYVGHDGLVAEGYSMSINRRPQRD